MLQLYDKNSSTTKSTCNLNDPMSLEHTNITMTEIIDVDLTNEEFMEQNSLIENNNATVNYKDVLDVATELCGTVSNDPK